MSAERTRTWVALVLQGAALGVLLLALLGGSWLDTRSRPRMLVLIDRSNSVPRDAGDKAVADILRAEQAADGGEVQRIEFAGRPAPPSARPADAVAPLEPSVTNIEAALEAALQAHAGEPFARVVIVSDGLENVGDAARALRAARDARLPVHWVAAGRAPPPTHVAEVLTPDRALVGQRIQVTVQLAGQLDRALRVKATARTAGGEAQSASAESDAAGRVAMGFDARRSGIVAVDVALEDPVSGRTLDVLPDAAVVDVAPRAAILLVQGSPGPLAGSLVRGGWPLQVVPATQLDRFADGLDGYQTVVLDDVAISDASPRFWKALVDAVRQRGLGLMVLGGERSFARGGYRGSVLESVLPVSSEPPALDQPASILFAVDKSGSMGQGSSGVDRFALAQRAVLETAQGLGERDSLGLMVFDVVPRLLIPIGPAPAATLALARDWQASPHGGTKLVPALEAAISELERSRAARRMMVVVTDGFINDAPLAGLRARLDRSHIEIIALAVGPDADLSALERVLGADAGLVLRVDQAAELPTVMRTGLERRRARVERGSIAVQQTRALPFEPGIWQDWPAVNAHAVTRSQPGAIVAVQSQRGEPLIALHRVGHGRVVAVTSGLGSWTSQWLQWAAWPKLAGGLTDWVTGTAAGVPLAMAVSDLPAGSTPGLQVEFDSPAGAGASQEDPPALEVNTPTTQGRLLATDLVAPGRWRATLPEAGAGLYTFQVSTPRGTRRQLHLLRHRAEDQAWGTSPKLDAWKQEGLISTWEPGDQAAKWAGQQDRRPIDRSLIGLGLALFLCGVLVDRATLNRELVSGLLRRWRARG